MAFLEERTPGGFLTSGQWPKGPHFPVSGQRAHAAINDAALRKGRAPEPLGPRIAFGLALLLVWQLVRGMSPFESSKRYYMSDFWDAPSGLV